MKRIEKMSVEQETDILVEVLCNGCGTELWGDKVQNGDTHPPEYLDVEFKWGYSSKYDFEIHKFQLCEKCYATMIKKFKIPVTVDTYGF